MFRALCSINASSNFRSINYNNDKRRLVLSPLKPGPEQRLATWANGEACYSTPTGSGWISSLALRLPERFHINFTQTEILLQQTFYEHY